MKVLMLADGTSIHTRRILDWHLRSGCEVTFVDFVDPNPVRSDAYCFERYPGLRGARHLEKIVGRRRMSLLNDRAAVIGLKRIFRAARPDVVHLYQIDMCAHHCIRARMQPLVMSSWGTDINQHFLTTADAAYRDRVAQSLAGADLVIADSTDIIDKCTRLAGKAVPAELLRLGINTELFRPGYEGAARKWRDGLDVPADACLLLSIRALTPLYGHHHILDAFHAAFPMFRKKAYLVFKKYNNKGTPDYKADLQRHGQRLGISDSLRWSDCVEFEQLPSLYAAADAIINYPSMDGFPVTFLEAAACKCPVITNRLPSYVGTFVETHFHMVEAGNLRALANAMVETVNETRLTHQSRLKEVRALIEDKFSEAASAGRLMAIYNDLTVSPSKNP